MMLDDNLLRSFGLGKVIKEKPMRFTSLDFHRTHDIVLATSDQGYIKVFDITTGEIKFSLQSHKYGTTCGMCTHLPSSIIHASDPAMCENHLVRYLDTESNRYIRYFKGHTDRVNHMSMCPVDDTFVSSSSDKTVRIWDLRDRRGAIQILTGDTIQLATIDQQGMVMGVAAPGGEIQLYDRRMVGEDGFEPFETFLVSAERNMDAVPTCLKFNNNQTKLLVVYDERIHILDGLEGRHLATLSNGFNGETKLNFEASFSPCGTYIMTGCQDKSVQLVRLAREGTTESGVIKVAEWRGHAEHPHCAQFAPRRMLAVTACTVLGMWIPPPMQVHV